MESIIVVSILSVCLFVAGYMIGKASGRRQALNIFTEEVDKLQKESLP